MLEEIIKDEIETIIQEKGLTQIIKDIVKNKMSNENILQIIEMEIEKLLPEAIAESVRYQLVDDREVNYMVHERLKEMVRDKISDWKL